MKRNSTLLILLLLFVVALGLRVWHLDYGLPRLYQSDEEFFVGPAQSMIAQGSLDPGWYGAPGHPLIYGTAAVFRVLNIFVNWIHGTAFPVAQNYERFLPLFQTAARALPALAGALTALLAYALGRRWSRGAGLWAAGLVATSFFLIDHSHIIRPDILQTLFLLGVLLGLVWIWKHPNRWNGYVLAGVSFGVACMTKYPSLIFLLPALVCAIFLYRKKRFFPGRWSLAAAVGAGSAFLTGPYVLLRPFAAARDIFQEATATHAGHEGLGFLGNLWWYLTNALSWEVGTVLLLLVAGTAAWLAARFFRKRGEERDAVAWLLLLSAVSYIVCLSVLSLHWDRWAIPSLTIFLIVAGIGIDVLASRLRGKPFALALVFLLLFAAPAMRFTRTLVSYTVPHTHDLALAWIEEHVPAGARIAAEPYMHVIDRTRFRVDALPNLAVRTQAEYRADGAEYFVLTDNVFSVILDAAHAHPEHAGYVHAAAVYADLLARWRLAAAFPPNARFSAEQLVESSDISVLRTLDPSLRRGEAVWIYAWNDTSP